MMIGMHDNLVLNYCLGSVRGMFGLGIRNSWFYQYIRWQTAACSHALYTYSAFDASIIWDLIHQYRYISIQIPIALSPELTMSQHPAVSSPEAYQTPTR